MLEVLLVITIDSNLGRVDISMLSDQTFVELFVEGLCEEKVSG